MPFCWSCNEPKDKPDFKKAIPWIMWSLAIVLALVAPWITPMPIAGKLATEAAVLVFGSALTAMARDGL